MAKQKVVYTEIKNFSYVWDTIKIIQDRFSQYNMLLGDYENLNLKKEQLKVKILGKVKELLLELKNIESNLPKDVLPKKERKTKKKQVKKAKLKSSSHIKQVKQKTTSSLSKVRKKVNYVQVPKEQVVDFKKSLESLKKEFERINKELLSQK